MSSVQPWLRSSVTCALALMSILLFGPSTARAVDDVDLHDINWYIHVDLVTVTEDLAYWQDLLDEQLVRANALIEGGQGPVDEPCCARLGSSASLVTFGTPGDGYDMLDATNQPSDLNGLFGGPGSNAFLVDSLSYCGDPAPGSVGCGIQPGCSGNGNDDPDLWIAVTLDALDSKTLPLVIAHERGHNACLIHVSENACQIMQGSITNPGMGGCFTATECADYRDGRTTTSSGLECSCHATAGGLEPDGTACIDFTFGTCSGGLCGDVGSDAVVRLVASAHPGSAAIPAPDHAVAISALSGDWIDLGQITPMADDIRGMAYARDSMTLFGVIPTSGNDSIVTIDAGTGELIATVGSLSNGTAELISMAYHPGSTSSPGDDRLIMIEAGAGGTVVWVDPASPSVRNEYGFMSLGPASAFQGLAYDSIQERLFSSTTFFPDNLYEIDITSCPGEFCTVSEVVTADLFPVLDPSLAFAPETGMLYQIGTSFMGSRTFYNVIDPTNGASAQTLSLDEMTPGGLGALPVAEPGALFGSLVALASVLWAGQRPNRAP
jgi:hypothetical protein